jgi:hypothetical protein
MKGRLGFIKNLGDSVNSPQKGKSGEKEGKEDTRRESGRKIRHLTREEGGRRVNSRYITGVALMIARGNHPRYDLLIQESGNQKGRRSARGEDI